MNNEPVAWIDPYDLERLPHHDCWINGEKSKGSIPLYTHSVKEQKCVVQDCENHKHEGSFNGDLCSPCYQFIVHGKGTYSQAYRNTYTVKELTDDEILEESVFCFGNQSKDFDDSYWIKFARAILRKASEK